MSWKANWKRPAAIIAVFLACYYLPVGEPRFDNALVESLQLVKWYAREHVLLCLVPATTFLHAGPAPSLPNMLVPRSIMDTQKPVVYISLAVMMSTITSMVFGVFF